jgi:nucleotide-binding universal stress UspA family protein
VTTTILCTDGSPPALEALASGLSLLRPVDTVVIVTVIEEPDEGLVMGASGFAGGAMSPETYETLREDTEAEGQRIVAEAKSSLGVDGAATHVLQGHPGKALCDLAGELSASAIVMGSRGRGGIKRALLGSVSDYVVRNAPCPVVITPASAD